MLRRGWTSVVLLTLGLLAFPSAAMADGKFDETVGL
jgi:hypothetical protein